jgi:hypothetical protein
LLLHTANCTKERNLIIKETWIVNDSVASLVDENSALFALKDGVVVDRRITVKTN